MISVPNSWTNFLALQAVLNTDDLYETRMINDSNGNVLYIGMAQGPGADTSLPIWYVFKLNYDGNGYINYKQLPNDGKKFGYIWDNVTTYFS
jgi:hypothetical protein